MGWLYYQELINSEKKSLKATANKNILGWLPTLYQLWEQVMRFLHPSSDSLHFLSVKRDILFLLMLEIHDAQINYILALGFGTLGGWIHHSWNNRVLNCISSKHSISYNSAREEERGFAIVSNSEHFLLYSYIFCCILYMFLGHIWTKVSSPRITDQSTRLS